MGSPASPQLSISNGAEVCLQFSFLKSCVILDSPVGKYFYHKGTPVLPFMSVINSGLAGDLMDFNNIY